MKSLKSTAECNKQSCHLIHQKQVEFHLIIHYMYIAILHRRGGDLLNHHQCAASTWMNAHRTPGDSVMKPVSVWRWLDGHDAPRPMRKCEITTCNAISGVSVLISWNDIEDSSSFGWLNVFFVLPSYSVLTIWLVLSSWTSPEVEHLLVIVFHLMSSLYFTRLD